MAPSPENDNAAPKAPDKSDKTSSKSEKETSRGATDNKHACVSKLNDGELKALLDEAINYKNPKDRVGKSDIFMNLLLEAEEEERNVRAERAVGSKLVRYCNPSAKKRHNSRHKREPSSVSENLTHGGSLNNLAKEELYETAGSQLLQRPRKSVSARQREGGSLPCNVNVSLPPANYDKQFFEEVRRKQTRKSVEYMEVDIETGCDSPGIHEEQQSDIELVERTRISRVPKFTTSATLQVGNVDDSLVLPALESAGKTTDGGMSSQSIEHYQPRMYPSKYNLVIPGPYFFNRADDEKLFVFQNMDENGNALTHHSAASGSSVTDIKKNKKKKTQTEKNVVVKSAKDVIGHRSDIINDVDKLNEYICGSTSKTTNHKSKLHKHVQGGVSMDDRSKKQRNRSKGGGSTKAAPASGALKKSSSLNEISSTAKLEELDDKEKDKPLRGKSSGSSSGERPRERRSWGNTDQLYSNVSAENLNLETAEFRVVTKKKKNKKRRNSISSSAAVGQQGRQSERAASPELRRKSACSVPHSEKSNDSSDVDSVHSLPADTGGGRRSEGDGNQAVSYADIARNSNGIERPKWNRPPSERKREAEAKAAAIEAFVPVVQSDKQDNCVSEKKPSAVATQGVQTSPKLQHAERLMNMRSSPPDVHNIHNFPSIRVQQQQQYYSNLSQDNNNRIVNSKQNSGAAKVYKNTRNNFIKNLKNSAVCVEMTRHNDDNHQLYRLQPMPMNIPDVQTIEKLHFAQQQQQQQQQQQRRQQQDCNSRPAVVIMSGDSSKEVPGLVFGFDVNEKLLSDDVFDSFTSRFFAPIKLNTSSYNHDKIVNFIGQAWEDIVNTKVQYYTENL